ncbi:hypothetical protein Hanom_Chr17g01547101 [Helianthus anomalus]
MAVVVRNQYHRHSNRKSGVRITFRGLDLGGSTAEPPSTSTTAAAGPPCLCRSSAGIGRSPVRCLPREKERV